MMPAYLVLGTTSWLVGCIVSLPRAHGAANFLMFLTLSSSYKRRRRCGAEQGCFSSPANRLRKRTDPISAYQLRLRAQRVFNALHQPVSVKSLQLCLRGFALLRSGTSALARFFTYVPQGSVTLLHSPLVGVHMAAVP